VKKTPTFKYWKPVQKISNTKAVNKNAAEVQMQSPYSMLNSGLEFTQAWRSLTEIQ
jgi:hypothetical protein